MIRKVLVADADLVDRVLVVTRLGEVLANLGHLRKALVVYVDETTEARKTALVVVQVEVVDGANAATGCQVLTCRNDSVTFETVRRKHER